jgi:hypothetical protein
MMRIWGIIETLLTLFRKNKDTFCLFLQRINSLLFEKPYSILEKNKGFKKKKEKQYQSQTLASKT